MFETQKKDESGSDDEEVGGLFRVVSQKQHQRQEAKSTRNSEDCSRFPVTLVRDWTQPVVRCCKLFLLENFYLLFIQ